MSIKGILFDLDGVIVTTDNYHYKAWKKLADEENIYFDKTINERLRGISRMDSLDIILEKSDILFSEDEKFQMARRKNNYYKELIKELTPTDILPGVINLLHDLKNNNIKVAIGSSSKNSNAILNYIGLSEEFDAIIDGNQITFSKPNPEVFLKGAKALNLEPEDCLVVEDAAAGVEAALAGNMNVLAVGFAATCCKDTATLCATDLSSITVEILMNV